MKIFIANTHSILNSGDAGIVLAQIQFLRALFPSLHLSLSSRTPELDKKIYHPLGVKIFPPIIPAPSMFIGKTQKISESFKNLFNIRSKRTLIKEIKQSDLVISSGGGYFWSHRKLFPGPMFIQNYLHIKLAVAFKKPVIFFPQSFDPLHNKTAAHLLKGLLEKEQVQRIFVREQHSMDCLFMVMGEANKVKFCPDMAFLLDADHTINSQSNFKRRNPIVAVTLRQWDFPGVRKKRDQKRKQREYLDTFIKTCYNIYRDWGGSIITFCQSRGPGQFEDDRIITKEFVQGLQETIPDQYVQFIDLPETTHPKEIIDILKNVDFLIATRLHSAIYGILAGIPVISLSYQHKGSGIMNSLGLKDFNLDISDFDAEKVINMGREIISQSEEIRRKIQQNVMHMRNMIDSCIRPSLQQFVQVDNHEDSSHQ